jgi:hypothetical protein
MVALMRDGSQAQLREMLARTSGTLANLTKGASLRLSPSGGAGAATVKSDVPHSASRGSWRGSGKGQILAGGASLASLAAMAGPGTPKRTSRRALPPVDRERRSLSKEKDPPRDSLNGGAAAAGAASLSSKLLGAPRDTIRRSIELGARRRGASFASAG